MPQDILDIVPFSISIDSRTIASVALWTLALCWELATIREWMIFQGRGFCKGRRYANANEQLERWFNFAERSLYTTEAECERTRVARESQNAF